MMDRSLNSRIELHQIESVPHSFTKRPELVVHGLHLDSVKGNESRLPGTLVTHVFDTVDGRLLLVNDYSIDISTEDDGYGCFVLSFGRFAEVYEAAADTCR